MYLRPPSSLNVSRQLEVDLKHRLWPLWLLFHVPAHQGARQSKERCMGLCFRCQQCLPNPSWTFLSGDSSGRKQMVYEARQEERGRIPWGQVRWYPLGWNKLFGFRAADATPGLNDFIQVMNMEFKAWNTPWQFVLGACDQLPPLFDEVQGRGNKTQY